ncbi:MAG: hypothetical protein WBO46_17345 [Caldilineaceae bacterium]
MRYIFGNAAEVDISRICTQPNISAEYKNVTHTQLDFVHLQANSRQQTVDAEPEV